MRPQTKKLLNKLLLQLQHEPYPGVVIVVSEKLASIVKTLGFGYNDVAGPLLMAMKKHGQSFRGWPNPDSNHPDPDELRRISDVVEKIIVGNDVVAVTGALSNVLVHVYDAGADREEIFRELLYFFRATEPRPATVRRDDLNEVGK